MRAWKLARIRKGIRPRPLEAGGPLWAEERRIAPRRLKRAAIVSASLHLILAILFAIGLPQRKRPSVRLRGIPIEIVSLTAPPSIRASAPRAATPAVETRKLEKPPEKRVATIKKPEVKRAQPVPVKEPAEAKPDLVASKASKGDSTAAVRGDVAFGGGGQGSLELGVEGPISPYAYYLMSVRDKVASNWNPPAGLATAGIELAAMVNFRIDRTGKIVASYVEEPSGAGVFDQAGLRAIVQSDPLPPLPRDYAGDWLGIHLRFVYKE